jgi:hypothetical protein
LHPGTFSKSHFTIRVKRPWVTGITLQASFSAFTAGFSAAGGGTVERDFQYCRPAPAKEADAKTAAASEIRDKRRAFMAGFSF